MRATRLSVAALVIGLASSLFFVAPSARGWRQECGPNDLRHRPAHLFERQQFTVAEMSFLGHPVAVFTALEVAANSKRKTTGVNEFFNMVTSVPFSGVFGKLTLTRGFRLRPFH
jgi:hypothetical protein